MPLYEYVCEQCKSRFEATSSIEDRKEACCPDCHWGVGKQQITAVAFDTAKMGLDPDFPTFSDKWAREHEKKGTPPRGRMG